MSFNASSSFLAGSFFMHLMMMPSSDEVSTTLMCLLAEFGDLLHHRLGQRLERAGDHDPFFVRGVPIKTCSCMVSSFPASFDRALRRRRTG